MEHNSCILIPLTGMEWNGQIVRFGDSRETVERILGASERVRDDLCCFKHGLRVEFDEAGRTKFIECVGGIDGAIQPQICGVKAFQAPADELLEILRLHNDGPVVDNEKGYFYGFLNLSVGIYRDSIPEDVDEMAAAVAAGDQNAAWIVIEDEKKRAYHWSAIGIGIENYYA